MTKCVAKQILGNWLEIFLTYLEIYSFDVEVFMEVDLNEQKHSCIMPFESSEKTHFIELKEGWTLMMEFVIIGKTMTSNVKTVFWKDFVVLCEHVENNFLVNELDYGQEKYCSRKRTQQPIDKHDHETEVLRKTTTIDGKLKRPVVKLAPMFYENVFREKTGPAMLVPVFSWQINPI